MTFGIVAVSVVIKKYVKEFSMSYSGNFISNLMELLKTTMTTPTLYGTFHIFSLLITVIATVALCKLFDKGTDKTVQKSILAIAILVILLEIYKQFVFSYSIGENGSIVFNYNWYTFPFQFCSTPMYIGFLAGIVKKGRFRDKLYAFLATFAIFAGLCVMIYPGDVFMSYVGINIQTMICHGSMISVGVALLYSGSVEAKHGTILKAVPVFATFVAIAMVLNEVAYITPIISNGNTFNMFFISPHFDSTLPVYGLIQPKVPFVISIIIYVVGFSLAAYLILLAAILIKKLAKKFDEIKEAKKA